MQNPTLWITIQEAQAIFCKANGSVWSAIYSRSIKARQSVVGSNWMLEYYSCLEKWGEPKKPELVAEIIKDVNS